MTDAALHLRPHLRPFLRLLGAPRVEAPGPVEAGASGAPGIPPVPLLPPLPPVPLRAERAHQLLALLALARDPQPRDRVATLFWPELDTAAARRNLRKALFRLRAQPGLPAMREPAGLLACDAATDVQAFEQALDEGRRRDALALWAGPVCDGLEAGAGEPFVQWLQAERERLGRRRRDAMLALIDEPGPARDDAAAATPGRPTTDPAEPAALARVLLAEDPLDEQALQALMRTALRSGEPAQALREAAAFEQRLRESLEVEPSAATRALRDQLLAAGSDSPAGAHTSVAAAAAGRAPASVAAPPPDDADFIGRRAELHDLLHLLKAPDARWVTLIGPGGTGKTRLLRHALPQAAAALGAQPLWLAFDDLAPGAPLLPRVAPALGLPWPGTPATAAAWAAALGGRRLLLGLDNLEHVAPGAAELAAVLQSCPGVVVLASSRERLNLPHEWLLPVPGLPWPLPEDVAEAGQFDAVRLFEQAARAVQPRLDVTAERPAVVALCAAVQGLPLALKLAAAWTRHLSLAQILNDLQQGAGLLQGGPGAESPQGGPGAELLQGGASADSLRGGAGAARGERPGGLEHVFRQSWARLAPAEQAALVALACCRGGFDAAAARAVAGAGWPLLAVLLDKSLLQQPESRPGAEPRFSLHPLLQQWLLARRDPRTEVARARHAQHFLNWLAGLPPGSRLGPRRAMLDTARLEQENLRAAWQQAVALGDAPRLAAATLPLMAVWLEAGTMADGLALLDDAEPLLPAGPAGGPLPGARAVLLLPLARYQEVEWYSRQALQAARRSGDTLLRRGALSTLGSALMMLGHGAAARRCIDQALALARQADDRPAVAHFLWKLSMQDHAEGDLDRAEAEVIESIALHEALGEVPLGLLNNRATMRHLRGDLSGARAIYQPALARAQARHDIARRHLEYNLALLALDEGDTAQAEARLAPLMQLLADGVQAELLAMGWLLQSRLHLAAGRLAQARQAVQAAGADALNRQSVPMMASALLHGALWRHASGDVEGALRWAAVASATPALFHLHRLLAERTLRGWGRPAPAGRPSARTQDRGAAEQAVRRALDELLGNA